MLRRAEFAASHPNKGKLGRRRRIVENSEYAVLPLGSKQTQLRRVQKALQAVRTRHIPEYRIILPPFQAAGCAFLLGGPSGRQFFAMFHVIVLNGSVPDGRTDDLKFLGFKDREELFEGRRVQNRLLPYCSSGRHDNRRATDQHLAYQSQATKNTEVSSPAERNAPNYTISDLFIATSRNASFAPYAMTQRCNSTIISHNSRARGECSSVDTSIRSSAFATIVPAAVARNCSTRYSGLTPAKAPIETSTALTIDASLSWANATTLSIMPEIRDDSCTP